MSQTFGILGGTFDPVHIGHLILAVRAREQLGLDELLLIPNARSPLKEGAPIASFTDRLRMLELATFELDGIRVSDIEGRRGGTSYMIDTIRALRGERPDAQWTLVMGHDAARELDSWHEADELRRLVVIAVAARSGEEGPPDPRVKRVSMPRVDISATEIRSRAAAGQALEFMTPAPVIAYIRDHALYRAL